VGNTLEKRVLGKPKK